MTSGIWAKSVLASQHAVTGKRIDTLLVRMPRCILAEFNTHRVFSRNAASSRAIPVKKIIKQVMDDPFFPIYWGSNKHGMQAGEQIDKGVFMHSTVDGEMVSFSRENAWLETRNHAVNAAQGFAEAGYHKQIINRLLEPWMWTIVCVTATEWDNFFKLRDHEAAEPHIQLLARAIYRAREEAKIEILEPGVWHLPFVTQEEHFNFTPEQLRVLSVARCASTSYRTVDDFDMTLERAEKIYTSLLSDPLHASPFEHVAQADIPTADDYCAWDYVNENQHRNFVGFRQLRAQIEASAV